MADRVKRLEDAVRTASRFFSEAMPKMNIHSSSLDVKTLVAFHEAEVAISKALREIKPTK